MLRIINLVKKYGRFTAVDNLSMEIGEGEIFGFVGSNGAGKTTTMKIVAGLLKQTSGDVLVDGVSISSGSRGIKKKIGYMPDFFGVYDDLKVDEYMDFYSGIYGVPYGEREAIRGQLLELVNLSHKRDAYVDSLSRGMKQRLCLARSLIHDPRLLILDEPASGLDPRARIEMKAILKELRSMGKTVLISSHILPELAELCTSVGIINEGRLVASGSVDAIMQKLSGTRKIRIRLLDHGEAAVRLLQEEPLIQDVSLMGDVMEADFKGNEEQLPAILKKLVTNDIPVISFSDEGGSLESVFMHLTKEEDDNVA